MITEQEQEFYKTFEIEPIPIKSYGYWLIKGSITENDKGEKVVYPEITDRKLLELICILVKTQTSYPINKSNIKDIKYEVLQRCVNLKSYIKQQIQQLFKEEK